jgi:hypothetical protein
VKTRSLALASLACIAVAGAVTAPARAQMVAGWDFSQYLGVGLLSIDGATFTDQLSANYSDLDPTFGAGAESAAFGTMHVDGTFGSTNVDEASAGAEFIPTSDSLSSNLDAPAFNSFDSFTILLDEQAQMFANPLSMIASGPVDVVFEADLTSAGQSGSNWSVSFGGRTLSGTSNVAIGFSSDGSSYGGFGSVQLTVNDTAFQVNLAAAPSQTGFVRLSFDPVGEDLPIIDNVAIRVPEPGEGILAVTAWLAVQGAVAFRRRGARVPALAPEPSIPRH